MRFEINDGNMADLAVLADKYLIDSLLQDLRVSPIFMNISNEPELYAQSGASKTQSYV